jgi:hypothetical protein
VDVVIDNSLFGAISEIIPAPCAFSSDVRHSLFKTTSSRKEERFHALRLPCVVSIVRNLCGYTDQSKPKPANTEVANGIAFLWVVVLSWPVLRPQKDFESVGRDSILAERPTQKSHYGLLPGKSGHNKLRPKTFLSLPNRVPY